MRAALLLLVVLMLAGCGESEGEKAAKAAIKAASRADFSEGVDVAGLSESLALCRQSYRDGCGAVEAKAQAIADATASCAGNDSRLCRAIANTKGLHQFTGGRAAPIPAHPFYWNLGNELLDAQASTFGYRREIFDGWLERWRVVLLAALGGVLAAIGSWLWWSWREDEAEEQAQEEAAKRAQEARQRAAQEHAKAEAARRAQDAARKAADDRARTEAQQAAENAAKAAAEAQKRAEAEAQAEAKQVKEATAAALAAAFAKPKR